MVRLALAEDFRAIEVLRDQWHDGSNRFDRPGEAFFIVRGGDRETVGVCGLNVDPYPSDPSVGRLRHLYVVPSSRRRRVGADLTSAVIDEARGRFAILRLRTDRPDACAFYAAMGFRRTTDEESTHIIDL